MNLPDIVTMFHFFDISIYQINLLSFMLGMTFAFFNQGFFGQNIGKWIFLYFAGLASWYFLLYYLVTHK
jgi:hypothetical protein